ncbi:hypothetical protein BD779DRAFT_1166771 [Infundibulicybe gibba]|nr:hypothetical protein BD779DRAFT_1166771 [Infundibulicybe gibba]
MQFEPSRKMILEAILLTVAEISADTGVPVIIFPKMQVADEDGINVVNPATGFQLCLTGDTDFGLCTYKTEAHQFFMLTAADNSAMKFAHGCVTLVADMSERKCLYDNMPEAISQAIALSERKRKKAVRFCISDGLNWVFATLATDEHGNRVSYQGELFSIIKQEPEIQEEFEDSVRQIVALVYHWLTANDDPFSDPLYTLEAI